MIYKQEFRKYAIKAQGMSSMVVDDYIGTVANMTRSVIEERPTHFREIDVFSRLIMDRIIFLGLPIDDNIGNIITAQLLFLESTDASRDILMYINTPGGSIYAGLGIYDTMQYINPKIATICTGLAASMGAILLCGGAAGRRSALPHSRIMMHQPIGGIQGQASDIEITAREIQKLKKELYEIIAHHSGKEYKKIWNDADRDYWMTAEEAKKYGIVDEILQKRKSKDA